jgi:hypothetical protein
MIFILLRSRALPTRFPTPAPFQKIEKQIARFKAGTDCLISGVRDFCPQRGGSLFSYFPEFTAAETAEVFDLLHLLRRSATAFARFCTTLHERQKVI